MFLVHSRHFESITHVFLKPGHTYNDADRDFATIENHIKGSQIYSLDDQIRHIRAARKRKPFVVTKMAQEDFLDFEQLKIYCTKRATPEGIKFSNACWFRVTADYKIGYELATNYYSLDQEGFKVRLAKGVGRKADENFSLKINMASRQKYREPLPLTQAKIDDLRYLVHNLVPKDYQDKYWNYIISAPSLDCINNDDDDDEYILGGFGDIYE